MLVAVIGDGFCSSETAQLAEEVGRQLAESGAVVICGGLGGVMEAACRGARGAGGLTIGVLPGRSRQDANPYVDIPIVTGMGEARNVIVVSSAQSVIAVSGGYGTLSEIAHALKLGIPVVGLGSWQLSKDGWDKQVGITVATGAADAVRNALALAKA
ncbi:MAG: TIGR00725 family protein [Chloroflexi bacterium B3_Chlor]|nr:MAG: TIGR00725 family protein [Chloroflexi bacterium B3_Chlor]